MAGQDLCSSSWNTCTSQGEGSSLANSQRHGPTLSHSTWDQQPVALPKGGALGRQCHFLLITPLLPNIVGILYCAPPIKQVWGTPGTRLHWGKITNKGTSLGLLISVQLLGCFFFVVVVCLFYFEKSNVIVIICIYELSHSNNLTFMTAPGRRLNHLYFIHETAFAERLNCCPKVTQLSGTALVLSIPCRLCWLCNSPLSRGSILGVWGWACSIKTDKSRGLYCLLEVDSPEILFFYTVKASDSKILAKGSS